MMLALELTAATFGVLGTILLALNGPRAGLGFVAYLASNAGWIWFAWWHSHWAMLVQQLAFTASSLLGIWVWLVRPWWHEQVELLDRLFDYGDPAPARARTAPDTDDDTTFTDLTFGTYALDLDLEIPGVVESRATMLVRMADIRCDESGRLPGEEFAQTSLHRAEVRDMLHALDDDVMTTIEHTSAPDARERLKELAIAQDDHAYASARLMRAGWLAAGCKREGTAP